MISVASKVEVISCLIQKSASCLYLTAHAASFGCVRPSTWNHEWVLLKLGSLNTLCLIQTTSLCFPKNSPFPSSTGDARQQHRKEGRISHEKSTTARGVQDNPPECWMNLSVLLSGLSDTPSPPASQGLRTSSTCIILSVSQLAFNFQLDASCK